MFAAGKTASSGTQPDAQFNYVTMLLHGDGTNGAQNNTFLDSSTNNFTITRNGNTTQGSFSPYGANWSVYNDGTSYLSLSANSALNQSGDLTIEGWVNLSATPSVIVPIYGFENVNFLKVGFNSSRQVTVDQSQVGTKVTGTTAVALGTWNHIALVRSGSSSNNCKIYLNGVQEGQFTDTSTCTVSGAGYIFRRSDNTTTVAGYLSNLRVTNTAVYTSAFTPSTTPLTAVTGTSLLTCQSNYFKDNSSNAFAISTSGTPSVQRFNPFGASTAYSTSVIGGSGYFDGTSDSLTYTGGSSLNFGTGDFTIELFAYLTNTGTYSPFLRPDDSGLFPEFGYNFSTGELRFDARSGSIVGVTTTMPTNQWAHIVACRSGTSLRLFVNGTQVGSTTTNSTNFGSTTGAIRIGGSGFSATHNVNGYLSDFRALKGTAQYTSNFTPPTAPLTAITNTTLLLSYTNGAIFDNAMMNDLETVGNAQISTSVKKYGTGSLAFDGSGDYLVSNAASSDLYAFGTGDFTIEFWLYLNSTSSVQVFYDSRPASAQGLQPTIYADSSGTLYYYTNVANRITGSSLSTNTWYHIAVARSGTSTKMFVNGTQVGSTYTDSTNYVNPALRPMIGADGYNSGTPGGNPMNGYIDDLRITKGYARYTANFTPPTAAFPNTGPI